MTNSGVGKSKTLLVIQYFFALFVLIFTLAPFVWLFISSISYQRDLITTPLKWIPSSITWGRYSDIFTNPNNEVAFNFKISMFNSLQVSIAVTVFGLIVGGLAAYAFARYNFNFKNKLLYLFLFTYMIPSVVIVIPLYLFLSSLAMLDSKITLVVLDLTFVIPFVIWIMQSYFGSISKEFDEASSIDGCNRIQTLWYIMFPIVRPGLIATAILAFLLSWDEFFFSLLFTSTLASKTIPVAIAEFSGKNAVDYGMICTGGILASIPPLLMAVIFQRFLVQGMTAGGVKE